MARFTPIILVIVAFSCSRPEVTRTSISEEEAMALASARCQSADLVWLHELIELAGEDHQYKGSIYAVPLHSDVIFVHQPWVSSCYACSVYNCDGNAVDINETERSEVLAGVNDDNLIYTSF